MNPRIWVAELPDGRARVWIADNIATVREPVVEIGPGESYENVPYEFWLEHVGRVVGPSEIEAALAARRASEAASSSGAVASGELARSSDELMGVRRRTAGLFALFSLIGGVFVLRGFTWLGSIYVVLGLPMILIGGSLATVWGILARSVWRGEAPSRGSVAPGWAHILFGLLLAVFGLRRANDGDGEAGVLFLLFGLLFVEAGRGYLRLALHRWEQEAESEV